MRSTHSETTDIICSDCSTSFQSVHNWQKRVEKNIAQGRLIISLILYEQADRSFLGKKKEPLFNDF